MKSFEYRALVIQDRGHISNPHFIMALNTEGKKVGSVECPICGEKGHAFASGWKHKEEQEVGANKLAILVEREIEIDVSLCHNMKEAAE